MKYDVTTIGDSMRDIFIFPDPEEMEKPVADENIQEDLIGSRAGFEKYLVFGLGDKITISDVSFCIGGTAANVAAALKKLGFQTSLISALGNDNAGEEIIKALKAKKVATENIKIYRGKKSSFSVIVSYKGERTIFVYHAFRPQDFILPAELATSWVYLGAMAKGFERLYNQIVAQVVKRNLKVALNPGACQIKAGLESFGGLKELLEIIFLNRQEAQELAGLKGMPQVKDLARVIQLRGPKIVVITDGDKGAYAYNGIDFLKVGPYPARRIDATGAGDAFAAGFLGAVIVKRSLQESLKWGVTNAAAAIEKIGAQETLSRNLLQRRAKEYRWPAATLRFS